MEYFIDVTEDPPAITGLKEWCANQIGEAIVETVKTSKCWFEVSEDEPPTLRFVTDTDFLDDEGMQDCIHKVFLLGDVLNDAIDRGVDTEKLKKYFTDLIAGIEKYEELSRGE